MLDMLRGIGVSWPGDAPTDVADSPAGRRPVSDLRAPAGQARHGLALPALRRCAQRGAASAESGAGGAGRVKRKRRDCWASVLLFACGLVALALSVWAWR